MALSISGAQARNAAKQATMHRTVLTTKNYLAQDVYSAMGENFYSPSNLKGPIILLNFVSQIFHVLLSL